MARKNQLSLWYFIGSLSLLLVFQWLLDGRPTGTLAYSEFKQVLRAGGLEDFILGDGIVGGRIRKEGLERVLTPERRKPVANAGEHRFVTALPLAARTPGFAGADLANLVNETTLRAPKRGHDTVQTLDFEDALDRIVAGPEKRNRERVEGESEEVCTA